MNQRIKTAIILTFIAGCVLYGAVLVLVFSRTADRYTGAQGHDLCERVSALELQVTGERKDCQP